MDISSGDVDRAWPEIVEGLSKGDKLRLSKEVERKLGMKSTFHLTKNILGYDRLSYPLHTNICAFYDKYWNNNKLILIPRKHFKTTMFTIGANIRHCLLNPNIAQALMTHVIDLIEELVEEIKSHFIHNEKFRDLYPEHAVKDRKEEGTKLKFTTPARKDYKVRMPTFAGYSSEKAIAGAHFNRLHFDDLIDRKQAVSKDMMMKAYESYTSSLVTAADNKEGIPWHDMIATRWDYADPYSYMIQEDVEDYGMKMMILPAEWKEKKTGERKILFPEEWNEKKLDYLRKKWGGYLYSCLMLNEPVPEGQAPLDVARIKEFDPKDPKALPEPLNWVITVDPASSKDQRKGDPTVIGVFSMDKDKNFRVHELQRGWWFLDEGIHRTIEAYKKWPANRIGVEKVSLSEWFLDGLEQEKTKHRHRYEVFPITRSGSGRTKEKSRHDIIQWYVNEDRFYVSKEIEHRSELNKEFMQYPNPRHDDILDVITDAINNLEQPHIVKKTAHGYRVPPRFYRGRSKYSTGYGTTSNEFEKDLRKLSP